MLRKSQSWSMDISIAVVIFLSAVIIFYVFLNNTPEAKNKVLSQQASSISKQIASADASVRIIDNNEVNTSKLVKIKNSDYTDIKSQLRVSSDFCIFLEDGSGNLVLINLTYKGIGAPNINLSGTPCSTIA